MCSPFFWCVKADGVDILRCLLEVKSMAGLKDKFLETFYNSYMRWVVFPFGDLTEQSVQQLAAQPHYTKHAKGQLCELLNFCVSCHGFRFKYFCIKNNIILQLVQLCRYPER